MATAGRDVFTFAVYAPSGIRKNDSKSEMKCEVALLEIYRGFFYFNQNQLKSKSNKKSTIHHRLYTSVNPKDDLDSKI